MSSYKPVEQKVVQIQWGTCPGEHMLWNDGATPSYLYSQCRGDSGLEKDLKSGWVVKEIWRDTRNTTILLERYLG